MIKSFVKQWVVLCFVVAGGASSATAQQVITLEQCVAHALEANYSIKIAANLRDIADNNATIAPFLPTVAANGSQTRNGNHSKVTYTNDNRTATTFNNVDNMSAGVALRWRLFDGLSMFATYDRQQQLLADGELRLRGAIESLVANISNQYYAILIQQGRVAASRQYLEISQLRYNQALEKYNIGVISGLEMKQAKIDLNADSSQLINELDGLKNNYIALYELANYDLNSNYKIEGEILPDPSLKLTELHDYAMDHNTSIQISNVGGELAQSDLKSARGLRYPTLDFSSGYNYAYNNNPVSVTKFNQTNGYNWGFSMSFNIFNGMETNRKVKNAKISLENSAYTTEQTKLSVSSELAQIYNSYTNNIQMIAFERESSEVAMSNLEAAVAMYRLGTLSGIAFREIQRSYLSAEIRKLSAIYQAKISEISLLYLSGILLGDMY